jgi:hypothetical protein
MVLFDLSKLYVMLYSSLAVLKMKNKTKIFNIHTKETFVCSCESQKLIVFKLKNPTLTSLVLIFCPQQCLNNFDVSNSNFNPKSNFLREI